MKSIMKATVMAMTLTMTGFAFAADSNFTLLVNSNSIANGAYKTIQYQICKPVPNSSHHTCGDVISVDIKDGNIGNGNEVVKVNLNANTNEYVSIKTITEKTVNGVVIATRDFSTNNVEGPGYPVLGSQVVEFDNFYTDASKSESVVTLNLKD